MPVKKKKINVTNSNKNNLISDSDFCILFYPEHKYCD